MEDINPAADNSMAVTVVMTTIFQSNAYTELVKIIKAIMVLIEAFLAQKNPAYIIQLHLHLSVYSVFLKIL